MGEDTKDVGATPMKTRWVDIGRHPCEKRRFKTGVRISEVGRSADLAGCPFCGARLVLYVWSFRSCGKRCECGALLSIDGYAYRRVDERVRKAKRGGSRCVKETIS